MNHQASMDVEHGSDMASSDRPLNAAPPQPSTSARTFLAATLPNIPFRPATKPPKETLLAVYAAGKYKANLRYEVLCVQSFMAGFYIAMAGHTYLSVGGGILGASLFPTGLIAVILTSGELFTGDALVFIASLLGGQVKFRQLLRNWTVAWCCNFIGALTWAGLAYASNALQDVGQADLAIYVAEKKAHQLLYATFIKGIGANFLVCVGIWQATCAEEVAGKVLALWFPVVAFVVMGFDHAIANQFYIPMGMMLGANVSVGRMFACLAMATLGNIVGGGLLVGAIYWFVFDSLSTDALSTVRAGLNRAKRSLWEATNRTPASMHMQTTRGGAQQGTSANNSRDPSDHD
jgi:formate/nitrite transporter